MAQFDLHPRADGEGYWLDCQTDLLEHLETRFVVPLIPVEQAPIPARHLNPVFDIGAERHVLLTQYAGTIPVSELAAAVGSLASRRLEIVNALDFLLTGV